MWCPELLGANTQVNASTCYMCIPLAERKVEKYGKNRGKILERSGERALGPTRLTELLFFKNEASSECDVEIIFNPMKFGPIAQKL